MKGSHGMGTAFGPRQLNLFKLQQPATPFRSLVRSWLPLLYKPMGKKLKAKLRISGRGMVTRKVLGNGKISVLDAQRMVCRWSCVNLTLQKRCMS